LFFVCLTDYQWSVTGSLKSWSILDEIQNINVPTLLVNGRYEQDTCVAPFFRAVKKVKWVTFENSSHIPHLEERERFMEIVADFFLDCY
jgi:L-proline amide hydrolase